MMLNKKRFRKKDRVKFQTDFTSQIQIGYLLKDKNFKSGFKVVSPNGNSSWCVSELTILEKI